MYYMYRCHKRKAHVSVRYLYLLQCKTRELVATCQIRTNILMQNYVHEHHYFFISRQAYSHTIQSEFHVPCTISKRMLSYDGNFLWDVILRRCGWLYIRYIYIMTLCDLVGSYSVVSM